MCPGDGGGVARLYSRPRGLSKSEKTWAINGRRSKEGFNERCIRTLDRHCESVIARAVVAQAPSLGRVGHTGWRETVGFHMNATLLLVKGSFLCMEGRTHGKVSDCHQGLASPI